MTETDARIGRSYEQVWNERSIKINKTPVKRMKMYRDEDHSKSIMNKTVLRGIFECNSLSDGFFSPQNIKNLQNQIRYNVWKESNHVYTVGDQDQIELSIVMRSLFLQYSKNRKIKVADQIKELNSIVIDDITPNIISNIQQYLVYLRDKQKPYRTIERPVNVSSAGLKSLNMTKNIGM